MLHLGGTVLDGNNKKNKIPKRIETKTLMRILNCLNHVGPQKRTNTSTYCNMSYSRFIPYLNFMLGINAVILDPVQVLNITRIGKDLLEYLKANFDE